MEKRRKSILLLGASGRTGLQIIEQGLKLSHSITALVRSPGKTIVNDEKLKVIKGNALDVETIAAAIPGNDVLVTALGVPNLLLLKKTTLYSESARSIIKAMESKGLKRLICLSAGLTGIKSPDSGLAFFPRVIMGALVWRTMYHDMKIMEELIIESGLDWTIVRPPNLADLPYTGQYAVSPGYVVPKGKMTLGRADLAHFVLKEVANDKYVRKAVAIGYLR
jgi:putative NADH-flavin reductase